MPGPSFVQGKTNDGSFQGATLTVAFTSNNTLGNLLLVQGRFVTGNAGPYTCTDTQGNAYVTAYSALYSGSTQRMVSFYCLGCKAGANTVSISGVGSTSFVRAAIAEISGVPATSLVESSAAFATGTGTVSTTGTVTTTGASDYLVAFGSQFVNNEASVSVGSPFTIEITGAGTGINDVTIADRTVTPGTYSAAFTYPTSTTWGNGLLAFKLPTGGVNNSLMLIGVGT